MRVSRVKENIKARLLASLALFSTSLLAPHLVRRALPALRALRRGTKPTRTARKRRRGARSFPPDLLINPASRPSTPTPMASKHPSPSSRPVHHPHPPPDPSKRSVRSAPCPTRRASSRRPLRSTHPPRTTSQLPRMWVSNTSHRRASISTTPHFTRGIGHTKVGLCPICIEPRARGGEGRQLWLSTKFT